MAAMKDHLADMDKSASTSKSAPIIVKKYANRRLYNTATSSYVTLENLAAMVRSGQDFVVQDAKTGEDITRSVLTQIIFEEESRGDSPLLPISFLRRLIRLYGDAVQGYVPGYLEMTMHAFERNQEAFRQQMARSFGASPGYAQLEAMARANMEMFRQAMGVFAPFTENTPGMDGHEPSSAAPKDEAGAGRESSEELDAMRARLDEMQRKLDDLAGK
ncbi:MAG: polyhydroxyalkanoate synthesis repressor PhaR [Neomegalonema sp.]|nr:polyhydroxyalkanoate synthesis repressor PhaR [Neomegalonema sp.]